MTTKATSHNLSRLIKLLIVSDQSERLRNDTATECNDRARLVLARRLADQPTLTSVGAYSLAMVLHHGAEYVLAERLARRAWLSGHPKGAWLTACIIDRRRLMSCKGQLYGTQYRHDSSGDWASAPFAHPPVMREPKLSASLTTRVPSGHAGAQET